MKKIRDGNCKVLAVGDLCAIWSGEGSCSQASDWHIGIIIDEVLLPSKSVLKNLRYDDRTWRYRALWHSGIDPTWYDEWDIKFDNHPDNGRGVR